MNPTFRPVAAVVLTLALAACATNTLEPERFDQWVGQDREALIEHWGEPFTETTNAASGERLAFSAAPREDELMPFQSLPPKRNAFGRDRSSPAVDLQASSPSQAPQLTGTPACLVIFDTDADDTVTGWALEGAGCEQPS